MDMRNHIKVITAVLAGFMLIAVPALAKPLTSKKSKPPTPTGTIIKCSKSKKSYTLKTLQSSSSRKDKLQQRYYTQVRVKVKSSAKKKKYKYETISTTKWRTIPNKSKSVLSTTPVKVSNVDTGAVVREKIKFRWTYKSKGKTKKRTVTRTTKTYKYKKFKGRALCKM